jgi:hypothetical protein
VDAAERRLRLDCGGGSTAGTAGLRGLLRGGDGCAAERRRAGLAGHGARDDSDGNRGPMSPEGPG